MITAIAGLRCYTPPVLLLALLACGPDPRSRKPADDSAAPDTAVAEDLPRYRGLFVFVTLDGAPVEGAVVSQGGNDSRWTTNPAGTAEVVLDTAVPGDLVVMAAHPDARVGGAEVGSDATAVQIDLVRFSTVDNPAYTFLDPGEPGRADSTAQCMHCHNRIGEDWFATPHRAAASNPAVHDVYAGAAAALDAAECAAAGGVWAEGAAPGGGTAERCYLGEGALPLLNECEAPCEDQATDFGGCADCHAPGIDGALGGRDLLEATGLAYDYGVHCDVCHKVEAVDLDAAPGVAGRLALLRPSEPSPSPTLGEWAPLQIGPYDDVLNPLMGSVQRPHFQESSLCAGCHQLDQPALVPGTKLDPGRWPGGRLPVQSTYAEWEAGPYAPGAPCQSCHMPPDAEAGNSADIDLLADPDAGIAAGWWRPPGAVRQHTWPGPRSEGTDMLGLAAALDVSKSLVGGELTASVTVRNAGPGHALPTGEPLRSLVLRVEAACGEAPLAATGGAAVPDFGGYLARKGSGEDWTAWPGALPGQRVRVVARTGAWYDYAGFGPFGDGSFSAEEKGMPVEEVVGSALILVVTPDGQVVLDGPLPEGDVAYRVDGSGVPVSGAPAAGWAGAPGFAFARVMVGAGGERMVHHVAAVDVASDNRLLPQQSWTSSHRFAAPCADPTVTAALLYRPYPLDLAAERGWAMTERVIAEVTR